MNEHSLPAKNNFDCLRIDSAKNDLVFTQDGHKYIDLFGGCGTVLLGHTDPAIVSAIEEQLGKVWITGMLQTPIKIDARGIVERFFPSSYYLASLCSTGMEAAELALRVARVSTGKNGVIGFEKCMHGKSMATAYLGWHNDLVTLPNYHRLPYITNVSEEKILKRLAETLATGTISAVFIELLQGSGGGHMASADFYQRLSRLCLEHGSLLVVDEILTGFYRTGSAFLYQNFDISPAIVLIGKAMGNGFPVSGVMVDRKHPIQSGMLQGSTYAENPLAASAVAATLSQMQQIDLPEKVAQIEHTITTSLKVLNTIGIAMRGKGALWVLEFPPSINVPQLAELILRNGVLVSTTGVYIRLLPAATISPNHLSKACAVIRDACLQSHDEMEHP